MALDYYFDPDDKLDRFGYAKFLRDLIENCDQYKRDESSEAYSIAIDSSWGTGKTYFFNMFENYLYGKKSKDDHVPESNPEFIVVNYNAWSNDYWDDAFAPFMQAILDNDRFMGTDSKSKLRRILESIIQTSDSTPAKIYTNYRSNSPLVQLRQKQQSMQDLKDCLSKMILDCKSRGLKKLVIIIDELDRCKPLFAIQTLEIVKHFLDVKNVVFIFAVDLEQLSHSIKSVYGAGIDAAGYLCKFYDYITKFPQTNILDLIRESLLQIDPYVIPIEQKENSEEPPSTTLAKYVHLLFTSFSLSIRGIQTILQCYQIMFNGFLYEYCNLPAHMLYLLFLAIKYKSPEKYQIFLTQPNERSSIISSLPQPLLSFLESNEFLKKALIAISNNSYGYLIIDEGDGSDEIDARDISIVNTIYSEQTVEIEDGEGYTHTIFYTLGAPGLLFYPDFMYLDTLKKVPFADYIFKRLENYEFPEVIRKSNN